MTSDTYLEDNTRLPQTWILHYKTIPLSHYIVSEKFNLVALLTLMCAFPKRLFISSNSAAYTSLSQRHASLKPRGCFAGANLSCLQYWLIFKWAIEPSRGCSAVSSQMDVCLLLVSIRHTADLLLSQEKQTRQERLWVEGRRSIPASQQQYLFYNVNDCVLTCVIMRQRG